MNSAVRWSSWIALGGVLACGAALTLAAAEPPAAPKVSKFAPAEDLVAQASYYVGRMLAAVESESQYKDDADKVVKDANTLAVIGLALGLHDEENKYQKAAPGLIKAAQALAAAKDYAAAKAGVAAVQESLSSSGDPSQLKWEKVASLKALMEQVPLINSRLKRSLKGPRFKSMAKDTSGDSAAIAAIGQGSMSDRDAVKNPTDEEKWYKFCAEMRDAAAAVNTAIHAQDRDAAEKAMGQLAESCDNCHAVFKPK
jgi:hypothetical protein